MKNKHHMLSLINLFVKEGRKIVISQLHAVFEEGYTHGFFAPDAEDLRPLVECLSGQRTPYTGRILFNDRPLIPQDIAFIDLSAAAGRRKTRLPQPVLSAPAALSRHRLPAPDIRPGPPGSETRTSNVEFRTPLDTSKKIILLHHLLNPPAGSKSLCLSDLIRHGAPGKTMLITSHDYAALRSTCDYIYLFDKKRFPIVVEKADFAGFDDYFKNVFGPRRPH